MISPTRFSSPTRTMSYMRAPIMPSAMTAGPVIRWILPSMAIQFSCLFQLDVEADGAAHQVLHVGDGVAVVSEGSAQARHAEYHGEVAATHGAFGSAGRVLDEPLVHDHQTVVAGLDDLLEGALRLLGHALAHLYASQTVADGRLGVGEHQHPRHG